MHYVSLVHFVEGQDPLPIANTPYFPESEYLTREARIFKLLRQTILKQQEDAKAREDHLLQSHLCLSMFFFPFLFYFLLMTKGGVVESI